MKRKSLQTKVFQYLILWILVLGTIGSVFAWMNRPIENDEQEIMFSGKAEMAIAEDARMVEPNVLATDIMPSSRTIGFVAFLILASGYLLHYGYRHLVLPIVQLGKTIRSNPLENISHKQDYLELEDIRASHNAITSKLDAALSYQKRFNASMAHELKTPLSVIKTHIDVLNEQSDKTIEDYQNTLNVVSKTVKKMNALVETLLDTSQEGQDSLNDVLNVEELIMDVVDDLSLLAEDKGVKLNYHTHSGPISYGNQVLIYRALYNLVENAIKYNKKDGMVEIVTDFEEDSFTISIKDNGRGIAQKDLAHIFEPFYRSENHAKDGLGLGLALVQTVVNMHSGRIEVVSREDVGSTFILHFPYLRQGGQA